MTNDGRSKMILVLQFPYSMFGFGKISYNLLLLFKIFFYSSKIFDCPLQNFHSKIRNVFVVEC